MVPCVACTDVLDRLTVLGVSAHAHKVKFIIALYIIWTIKKLWTTVYMRKVIGFYWQWTHLTRTKWALKRGDKTNERSVSSENKTSCGQPFSCVWRWDDAGSDETWQGLSERCLVSSLPANLIAICMQMCRLSLVYCVGDVQIGSELCPDAHVQTMPRSRSMPDIAAPLHCQC